MHHQYRSDILFFCVQSSELESYSESASYQVCLWRVNAVQMSVDLFTVRFARGQALRDRNRDSYIGKTFYR
jgi:hypothetical protein